MYIFLSFSNKKNDVYTEKFDISEKKLIFLILNNILRHGLRNLNVQLRIVSVQQN